MIIIILLLWYYFNAMTIHWIMIVIVIVVVIVVVIVIICNGSMYISSCSVLSCLDLVWVDYYYYCYYKHDVVWACVTLPYHIISYLMFFYFISSADLIFILFYSILFYFISNWFDSIWFYFILFYWNWFTIFFSIVSHINEWFVSICPSVCLFVRLCVYLYE